MIEAEQQPKEQRVKINFLGFKFKRECKDCGKEFKPCKRYPEQEYCSDCLKKRRYARSYHKKGWSKESLVKVRRFGEKNPFWKGGNVGYYAMHAWIRNHKSKPLVCEICGLPKKLELANISPDGKYHRDINLFLWVCRKCHMENDGRIKRNLNRGGKLKTITLEEEKETNRIRLMIWHNPNKFKVGDIIQERKKEIFSLDSQKEKHRLKMLIYHNADRFNVGDIV